MGRRKLLRFAFHQESTVATEADLFKALHRKCGFEVVSHTWMIAGKKLRISGRVPKVGSNIGNYLVLMRHILVATARGLSWTADLSDHYILKSDGKMVYERRWLLQGEELEKNLEDVIQTMKNSPSAQRKEAEEVRLYGLSPDRNNTAGGKRGAGPVGSVPVGPMAAMRKNMGG
jgi:hypothetical protein